MGLFGFGKKKYVKNVSRNNEFLKEYAIKTNGLIMYAENNETVLVELNKLKDDFQYTVASYNSDAKDFEKNIDREFTNLVTILQQPEWSEEEVLLLIKGLRRYIVEISSLR